MLERAFRIQDRLVRWRRGLHMHPELGFQEFCSSSLVAETLGELGYRVRTQVGHTGVIGERGDGSPIGAIRADMDTLPLQETNQVPHVSQNPGRGCLALSTKP